jgi:hypothetical protein
VNRNAEAVEILAAIKAGEFLLKTHAGTRSLERALPVHEIQHIAETAISHEWQETKGTHQFIGYRSNGKGAGFTAKREESGVWVVTVFKRTLKKKESKK